MTRGTMICFDGIVDVELDGICFAWYKAQEELVAEWISSNGCIMNGGITMGRGV